MFEKLKQEYNQIQIPVELNECVENAIACGKNKKKIIVFPKAVTAYIAAVLMLIVLLNTSPVFAEAASNVPIIGNICKVLTFREYHYQNKINVVDIVVPKVVNDNNSEWAENINKIILDTIEYQKTQSEKRAQEYYNAYVETGGNPSEFKPVKVNIDYTIFSQDESTLSFKLTSYNTVASAYFEEFYYNINPQNGKKITLENLFGENYVEVLATEVDEQIANFDRQHLEMMFAQVDVKKLINKNREFYINKDGNIVLVFQKYELAVGAAGQLEFCINKELTKN